MPATDRNVLSLVRPKQQAIKRQEPVHPTQPALLAPLPGDLRDPQHNNFINCINCIYRALPAQLPAHQGGPFGNTDTRSWMVLT